MVRESLGHYEILGPLGAGGMGEVFAARDPKLGRKVAIKILPLRLANERDTLTRFTQEARSASALNHPNIVTIHEVGTSEGSPFIVMEFIDGRDVRSIIAEGPLTARRALDLAVQIADGLAAAHERGIVHRDLKPENIMVTRDGYVKILDFGLAKMVTAPPEGDATALLDLPSTNPGTILGTVGYMSPEQATGRRVDFRSDQFAFGAILYELVTGRPAFGGETAIDTLSAILHDDPVAVTKTHPRTPVQLGDIIRRLLEKTPDDRYSSTRDLARELHMLRDRVAAEESGFRQTEPHSNARRTLVGAVVALAFIAFIAGVLLLRRAPARASGSVTTSAAAPAAAKKYLAVMRFKDLTGDPRGQFVVDGFAETLTTRLAGFRDVQVMRAPASETEQDVRKVAHDLGATLVLTGSMMRSGDRIRVTYSVIDAPTGREWRDLVEGALTDLFSVQDRVAESVAQNLRLTPGVARAAIDPAVSQTRYLEALGHMLRYDSEESVNVAIEILQQLGTSPSVQAALARAYLLKFSITAEPELAVAAERAAARAMEGDPHNVDVNVTIGDLRRQTARYPEAVAAYLRVLSQQPNNADAVLGLAETYKGAGDLANAEAAYRRAIALQPKYWAPYNKLGVFYFVQGRYEDAIPQFETVIRLVPDNIRGYNNLGSMYERLGRYDEAVRVFKESIRLAPSGQAWSNLGTCHYFMKQYGQAAAAFEKAVELTPHDYLYWRNLGDAYRWVPGREADARRAFSRSIELCDEAIRVNASDARAYTVRATSLAKVGRPREARASIVHSLELEPRDATHIYEAAVIANIAGDEDEAVVRLEQALRRGASIDEVQSDPEFANLRKNGRLAAIVQGLQQRRP